MAGLLGTIFSVRQSTRLDLDKDLLADMAQPLQFQFSHITPFFSLFICLSRGFVTDPVQALNVHRS